VATDPRALAKALVRANAAAPTDPAGGFGAFAPTMGPAGSGSLAQPYGNWSSGRGLARMGLPRDPAVFQAGSFGPLTPLLPMPIDTPDPDTGRQDPRRWQYPVSWNMPNGVPGSEGLKLSSFANLRVIGQTYSVARACIELRKNELLGLGWDIVPTKAAEKAMRGNESKRRDFDARRAKMMKFWRRPDQQYFAFRDWFKVLLDNVLVIDALSLYLWPASKPGKGVMGSNLGQLAIIDGATIRPLLDTHGATPLPPNPGYQQYLFGVPRSDFVTMQADEDIAGYDSDSMFREYPADRLIYRPFTPQEWTPYGFSPIEQGLVPILSGIQRQQYQLDFFSEGTIPGLFVSPGDSTMTPQQLRELQDALNAMAGDPAWKHKIIVLPPGSTTDPQTPADLAGQFDELVMSQVCCVPGTEVVTRRGLVAIEDVSVGDQVLTHRGNWRAVRTVMANPVHESVRRIAANGLDPLEVTGNHPVWTARYGQSKTHAQSYEQTDWIAARDVRAKQASGGFDALTLPLPVMGSADAQLRLADHIKGHRWPVREENDRLLHPHPHATPLPAHVPMGAAFGRLLGLYMAEGSASKSQVFWYFHEDEVAYQQQVIDDLATVFGLVAKVVPVAGEKCVKLVCNSAMLSELLSCGTARNKVLPAWVWDGSPEFYASLLWGWIAGDGCLTPTGWRGYTMSRTLAWQMRLVAVACGHEPQFRTQPQTHSSIGGRALSGGGDPMYVVQVVLNKRARGTYRIDGPHLTSAVRSNEPSAYAGDVVYNLEVDGDESYVTTGGTVHNCMAFSVMPMELGITPKASSSGHSGGAANQMAKQSSDVMERKSNKPMLEWFSDIFNHVIQDVCGQEDMKWWWEGLEADEDLETQTGIQKTLISMGLMSIDEGRVENGNQPWGLPITSDPILITPTGVIPFGSIDPETGLPKGTEPTGILSITPGAPAPSGGSGPPGSPPKPAAGQPAATPAHAGAVQGAATTQAATSATPATQAPAKQPAVPAAKMLNAFAALRELDTIRRRLNKGRTLNGWTPEHVPPDLFATIVDLDSLEHARKSVRATASRQRRDDAIAGAEADVSDRLRALTAGLATGDVSTVSFVDQAVTVMRDGIRTALGIGAGHARQDGPLAKTITIPDSAEPVPASLNGRFGLYASAVPHAYEQGFGLATVGASDDPDSIVVSWHTQPGACPLCAAREGEIYTVDTLPGLPGEGEFGGPICNGGPNCRCRLEYRTIGIDEARPDPVEAPTSPTSPSAPAPTVEQRQIQLDVANAIAALHGPDPEATFETLLDQIAERAAEIQRGYLAGFMQDILAALASQSQAEALTVAHTVAPDGGRAWLAPASVIAAITAAALAEQVQSQQSATA
jgi:Hint domain-containing protein